MATELLQLSDLLPTQTDKFEAHNADLRKFEAQVTRALSRTVTDPGTLTPAEGDVYIVPTGAIGAWAGQGDDIAYYYGATWNFITPVQHTPRLYVVDESVWVSLGASGWFDLTGAETELTPVVVVSSVAGVLTLDLSLGRYFTLTLTENITSVVLANSAPGNEVDQFWLEVTQAATPWTITWGAGWNWSGGVSPVLSATSGNVDGLRFVTYLQSVVMGEHFLKDVGLVTGTIPP